MHAHARKTTPIKERAQKAVKAVMAAALAVGLLPVSMLGFASQAFADSTAQLEVGHRIDYAGYYTNYFEANGNIAYCANPSKATPPSGTYEKGPLSTTGNIGGLQASEVFVALGIYYSYGGPGFDPSMWPSAWYDGSSMSADRYMALSHILLADICSYDSDAAMHGCDSAFKSWCATNVLGGANSGSSASPSSTKGQMISRYTAGGSYIKNEFVNQCFMLTTGSSTQIIVSFTTAPPTGSLELYKSSSNPSMTNGNACYSLAGAKYQVSGGGGTFTLTTDANGYARVDDIPAGSYTVREVSPSKGYGLGSSANVTVSGGETAVARVTEPPQNDPAAMWVGKIDLETTENMPQGSASLAGAEYTVKYYTGYYSTAEAAQASGQLKRTWIVRTDEDGYARLGEQFKVGGDDFYYANGRVTIPLGTLTIQESKAPEGYILADSTVFVRQVTTAGYVEDVYTYDIPQSPEQVIRGGVSIEKRDLESGLLTPLGNAEIDGTSFEIVNKSPNAVMVDGESHEPGEVVKTITAVDGIASTSADALPYGDYIIRESAPSVGYLQTDDEDRAFSITENGKVVGFMDAHAAYNQVKRGDIEFVKVRENDQKRLAGVPFLLTSNTTGESHLLVTDENGEAKTAASWNKHTYKTNANDKAYGADGKLDESALDAYAGIWFGLTHEGTMVDADDALCALPYDTYTLQELPCEANEGLDLVKIPVTIARDGNTVNLGSIDDQPEKVIYLSTVARDAYNGDKTVFADPAAKIVDRVEFMGVTADQTYKMQASLHDAETGEALLDADGEPIEASKLFTSPTANGWIEVDIPFDARDHAGASVVVYEQLIDPNDGKVLAEHSDKDDYDQTVAVIAPSVGTTAANGFDGSKLIANVGQNSIIDTIRYANLLDGATYTAAGSLMAKTPAGVVPLTDAEGKQIKSSTEFIPAKTEGTVEVRFDFEGLMTDGLQIVVYETILRDGKVIAVHEDPDDANQTVTVADPSIRTTLSDAADGDKIFAAVGYIALDDEISYQNLAPGIEYEVSGTLMTEGEEGITALLDKEGNPVTASATFTAEASSGTATVRFEAAADIADGQKVVAYEKLHCQGKVIAAHEDPDDADQTATGKVPEIATVARDASDDDKVVIAGAGASVVDTVRYSGLPVGREYTVEGAIMVLPDVQASDIEDIAEVDPGDVEPLLDENGNPVTASAVFTPTSPDGAVEATFNFDASELAGKSFVVYEKLLADGAQIAAHEDPNDADQRFYVVATTFSTEALSQAEDHFILGDAEALINDLVFTTNIKQNESYTAYGLLFDPETGLPASPSHADADSLRSFLRGYYAAFGIDEDYEIAKGAWGEFPRKVDEAALAAILGSGAYSTDVAGASVAFEPAASSDKCQMTYTFDARELEGAAVTSIVMLVDSEGNLVAAETDIACEAQTVALTDSHISTAAADASDGDQELLPSRLSGIKDTVSYEGLKPGRQYTLMGYLYEKSTEKVFMVADQPAMATAQFVPSAPSGTAEVDFVIDSSESAGADLVVFEYLYLDMITSEGASEQVLVAEHADIEAASQTVHIAGSELPANPYDQTGFDSPGNAALMALSAVLLTIIAAHELLKDDGILSRSGRARSARGREEGGRR